MIENSNAGLDQTEKTSFKADRLSIDRCLLLVEQSDCKPDSNATNIDLAYYDLITSWLSNFKVY